MAKVQSTTTSLAHPRIPWLKSGTKTTSPYPARDRRRQRCCSCGRQRFLHAVGRRHDDHTGYRYRGIAAMKKIRFNTLIIFSVFMAVLLMGNATWARAQDSGSDGLRGPVMGY